uniref:peptidyl-tRNA hydrolase n=1 Tax=Aegilops tauschii TaxID=37682 RepID=M8BTY3_AEGTA
MGATASVLSLPVAASFPGAATAIAAPPAASRSATSSRSPASPSTPPPPPPTPAKTDSEDDSDEDDDEIAAAPRRRSEPPGGSGPGSGCCSGACGEKRPEDGKGENRCAMQMVAFSLTLKPTGFFIQDKGWERCGQVKVVVKVESEEDMLVLQGRAKSMNLPTHITIDAGRTQIAPNSRTVMAILGPADMVDDVTGGLKLL